MNDAQIGGMFGLLIIGVAMMGVGAVLSGEENTAGWGRWIGIAHTLPPVVALWVLAVAG